MHLLFFYLKHRFNWDAADYGYLKGPTQGAGTFMVSSNKHVQSTDIIIQALFAYPLFKRAQVTDTTLALIGVCSRMLGRFYLAIVWNSASVFACKYWVLI